MWGGSRQVLRLPRPRLFVAIGLLVISIWTIYFLYQSTTPEDIESQILDPLEPIVELAPVFEVPEMIEEPPKDFMSATEPNSTARLHLLIPATSSVLDLCKLLVSGNILGYPVPLLINFGDPEMPDPYVQHVAKVKGLLDHLKKLHKRANTTNDLVLIIDGYDIWFQLPPEVLLKRYFAINSQFDQYAEGRWGAELVKQKQIKQTILFGPDKLCWPVNYTRAACWAVPEAPVDKFAFGPRTFAGPIISAYNMPQWLNSGTIMGPIGDLVDLMHATLDRILHNFTLKSDQLYFSDIFGTQEYSRLALLPGELEAKRDHLRIGEKKLHREAPVITPKVEYHVGLDYTSTLFQTVAFYRRFLTWTKPHHQRFHHNVDSNHAKLQEYYTVKTPLDVRDTKKPFSPLKGDPAENTSWDHIPLLHNLATHEVPVMVHYTGDKYLRISWWRNMWFHKRAKALRAAALAENLHRKPLAPRRIAGKWWFGELPEDADQIVSDGRGDAWSDSGGWFSWNTLCKAHEEKLYAATF